MIQPGSTKQLHEIPDNTTAVYSPGGGVLSQMRLSVVRAGSMTGRVMRAKTILLMVLVLFARGPANAAPPTAQAKQFYDDGVTSYNLGHYDEALRAFESGYRIRHDPAFLFNIAQCQRQLHRYDEAERSYRAYLRESSDLSESTREQVQKLIAEMRKATDDGRAQALSQSRTEAKTESAAAQPQVAAPPPLRSAVPGRPWYRDTPGMALLGGGIAVAAVGAALFGVGVKDEHEAVSASTLTLQRSLDSTAHALQPAGVAMLAVGGASIAVGSIVLAVRSRPHGEIAR